MGCIEQGLLLYRIRKELQMTLDCYRKAYESGVCFGLGKAVEAEVQLEQAQHHVSKSARLADIYRRLACDLIIRLVILHALMIRR